jgi:hypothetical protein
VEAGDSILFIPPPTPPESTGMDWIPVESAGMDWNSGGFRRNGQESTGMNRNSRIPADSGGIRGGIHLQFTIKDIIT